jgi:hypothetical protein
MLRPKSRTHTERKACKIDGITNECLRQLPTRRPLVHLTNLFNYCIQLSHFPKPSKEAKRQLYQNQVRTLNFPQIYARLAYCPWLENFLKKVMLKIFSRHTESKNSLNASQFGFRANHNMTLQCMRLTDHITLNFNNKISTAAVFWILKRPLKLYGTQDCYIHYLQWNFRPI